MYAIKAQKIISQSIPEIMPPREDFDIPCQEDPVQDFYRNERAIEEQRIDDDREMREEEMD